MNKLLSITLLLLAAVALSFLPKTIIREVSVEGRYCVANYSLLNGCEMLVVNDSTRTQFVWFVVGDTLIEVYN